MFWWLELISHTLAALIEIDFLFFVALYCFLTVYWTPSSSEVIVSFFSAKFGILLFSLSEDNWVWNGARGCCVSQVDLWCVAVSGLQLDCCNIIRFIHVAQTYEDDVPCLWAVMKTSKRHWALPRSKTLKKKRRKGWIGELRFLDLQHNELWTQQANRLAVVACCCCSEIKTLYSWVGKRGDWKSGSVSWISFSVVVLIMKGNVGWKACGTFLVLDWGCMWNLMALHG